MPAAKFCPITRAACEHAEACPFFGCPRDRHQRPVDDLPPVLDRERLGKVLALLASPNDGEALAATRIAVKLLAASGLRPEQLVPPPAPAVEFMTFRYSAHEPPPNRPARAWPFGPTEEEVREDLARSLRLKPGQQPKSPKPKSFRDIGPGEARERLRRLLETPVQPKPRAFVAAILSRLQQPHTANLTPAEIRRLNSMWRLFCELKAAA